MHASMSMSQHVRLMLLKKQKYQTSKSKKQNQTKRNEPKGNKINSRRKIERVSIYHKFLFLGYIRGSMLVKIKVVAIQVKVVVVAFPLDFGKRCAS